MKKETFLWILYFTICGFIIAAAIKAGSKLDHCHECPDPIYVNTIKK